jgi:hypothetical protein
MKSGRNVFFRLMGRKMGRDEQNAVQLQPVTHLFGRGQMAIMDGIECTAEDAKFLWQTTSLLKRTDDG